MGISVATITVVDASHSHECWPLISDPGSSPGDRFEHMYWLEGGARVREFDGTTSRPRLRGHTDGNMINHSNPINNRQPIQQQATYTTTATHNRGPRTETKPMTPHRIATAPMRPSGANSHRIGFVCRSTCLATKRTYRPQTANQTVLEKLR